MPAANGHAAANSNENSHHTKPLYEASTQFVHWRFSPEQLADTRRTLNAAAVRAIARAFEADAEGSSTGVEFLNAEDEQLLVKLYIGKVSQLCGHFRFPEEVEATAVSYLKRFYLKNTVMDWHPKNVMLTALFLATKTTNNPIALEAYTSAIPRTEPSDVLDLEFLVAQSLNFEFVVWHAHRALWGQWLDLQSLPQYESSAPDKAIYDNALTRLRASRLTDAELIYAPSQIALACLQLASPTLASEWLSSQSYQTDVSALLEPLAELIRTQGALPDVDAVREVDRRLKVCKNPEKVPGTRAFLAREDAETQAAADKRARKAAAAQSAMDAEDPFADPNGGNTTIVAAAAAATAGSQATEVEDDDDD